MDLLLLYKKTKSLKLKKFIKKIQDTLNQALFSLKLLISHLHSYQKFTILLNQKTKNGSKSVWIAAIQTYMEHTCKSWFGSPVQIWTFIPLSAIKSRVAYSRSKVDFGGIIGYETVYNYCDTIGIIFNNVCLYFFNQLHENFL